MSWTKLLNDNRVTAEPSSKSELDNLRSIVRNDSEYDAAGGITDEDADTLIELLAEFEADVEEWVKAHPPALGK